MTKLHSVATPRRSRRKDARPAEIVAAAASCFVENGYGGTKLEDVARRAGIAKGTVYLYFDTKQDLFEAVIRDKVTSALGDAEAVIQGYEGPSAQLLEIVIGRAYENLVGTDASRLLQIIIGEGHQFPELRKLYYDTSIRKGVAMIEQIVARGVASGEFRDGPATRNPRLLMGPCIMAVVWSVSFNDFDPLDIASFRASHIATILDGIRA